ncbi:DUF2889 domain-containing protein [Cupriavidus lacunae]|nr:DUF2889 domain-containing protein [Cupriavidus lacunae]
MITDASLRTMPQRAEYGNGVYVRSLQISTPSPGQVCLAMEDIGHAFQISLTHQDGVVTSVGSAWHRQPLTSCAGAGNALEVMVGSRLSDSLFDIARQTDASQQCTHMFDMFCLAATHAWHGREDRRYDVVVPDSQGDEMVVATLGVNGVPTLNFTMENYERIVAPEACRGLSVFRGFMSWVRTNVPADQHEHYFVMQKALFVARGQKIDMEATVGMKAALSGPPEGTCYGSQAARYGEAVRLATMRRFDKDSVTDVLTFFRPGQTL